MWRCELQPEDQRTPDLAVAARLLARRGLQGFAFLDTAMPGGDKGAFATGRWSFLTAEPFGVYRVRGGQPFWNDAPLAGAPLDALRGLAARFHFAADPQDPTPFRGGCVGYIAYDFAWRLERLAVAAVASGVEDMAFGFHDVVAALDHGTGRVVIYSSGFPEAGANRQARAKARGEAMRQILHDAMGEASRQKLSENPRPGVTGFAAPPGIAAGAFHASHDRPAWIGAVQRVQEYIRAGDIFQANIARRFSARMPTDFNAFDFYQALRMENPAPFGAFLNFGRSGQCQQKPQAVLRPAMSGNTRPGHGGDAASGALAIASSSPERFIALRNGKVETRPIKGTARRSDDPAQDAAAAAALQGSTKDRAENVMIVDLLRNDLSRVCAPGTVRVEALCALESYANVHHLTSVVQGQLAQGRDAFDLIAATFPGGSITGAPKIRAMDIITGIEGTARGVYCGAIGYIGFDGDMDLNIAIRTVTLQDGEAVFQAGGGITLLSDPASEYDETEAKAARLFSAFARHGRSKSCS